MIEIKIKINDIDYGTAIEAYLPIIAQKMADKEDAGFLTKMIGKNSPLSASVIKAALSVMPQSKKDEIAVSIIEKYKDEIAKNLMNFAVSEGLSFQLEDIQIAVAD